LHQHSCPYLFPFCAAPLTQTYSLSLHDALPISEVPAGTQAIVVLDSAGQKSSRPVQTPEGIPVLYPNRDGEVSVYSDGTQRAAEDRKSTRLNSSHVSISYAVFCLKTTTCHQLAR